MSGDVDFVDTNIIVYAHDRSAGEKREVAASLILRLDAEKRGALSVQVLQELVSAVTVRGKVKIPEEELVGILEDFSDWTVFCPGAADVIEALAVRSRYKISFWDAMIVHAALEVSAAVLWSEDLSDGQDYGGVIVRNPFRSGVPSP
jgi:predicted nucleic acid-binding protein